MKKSLTSAWLLPLFVLSYWPCLAGPTFPFCPDREWCNDAQQCHTNAILHTIINTTCSSDSLRLQVQIDFDQDGQNDILASNILPYPYPNPNGLPTLSVEVIGDSHGKYHVYLQALDFAVGEHQVYWQVVDACDESSTCQQKIDVKDCEAPVVLADDFHFTFIGGHPVCELRLNLDSVDLGSSDNCGILQRVLVSPSLGPGQLEPCESYRPTIAIFPFYNIQYNTTSSYDLWIQDISGNWSYSSHNIIFSEDRSAWFDCNLEASPNIEGTIKTEAQKPIHIVEVPHRGLVGYPEEFSDYYSSTTDVQGVYKLISHPGNREIFENGFEFMPQKNTYPTNGVSTIDMILISRHLIGTQSLDSPYKLLAADVDRNGAVTAFDLIALQRVILRIDSTFSNNNSWRFVPEHYVFDEPLNPFTAPIGDVFHIEDFFGHWGKMNFIGIKVGDVNLDATTCGLPSSGHRSQANIPLRTASQQLEAGKNYSVALKLEEGQELWGYQMALAYDTLALELISPPTFPALKQHTSPQMQLLPGQIRSNWYKDQKLTLGAENTLIQLQFKAKTTGALADYLQIDTEAIAAEAYVQNLETQTLQLTFENTTTSTTTDFIITPIYPNPLKTFANLPVHLNHASTLLLSIYDANGTSIGQQSLFAEKGAQNLVLHRKDFPHSGLYYLQIQNGYHQVTSKLMVID